MAFNRSNFDPIPSSKGLATRATYETTDNLSVVEGAGYFNPIVDNLRSPFHIMVFAGDGQAQYFGTHTGTVVSLGGDEEIRKIPNYTVTMGSSSVDPAAHAGTDDWLEVKVGGTSFFAPLYASS